MVGIKCQNVHPPGGRIAGPIWAETAVGANGVPALSLVKSFNPDSPACSSCQ